MTGRNATKNDSHLSMMGKPNSAAVCMAFHRGGPHTVGMGVYVGGGVASVSGAARTNGTGTGACGAAGAL